MRSSLALATVAASLLFAGRGESATLAPWTLQSSMNIARKEHASPTVGQFIYAIGGADSSGTVLSSVEYASVAPNGTVGPWVSTTPLSIPRYVVEAVGVGARIYVVGGWSATPCCSGTLHYKSTEIGSVAPDGSVTAWVAGPDLVEGMGNGGLTTDGLHLFYVGGFGDADKSQTVQVADINPDGSLAAWRLTTSLPTYRREAAAVTVFGGRVFAFGGYEPGYLDSVVSAPILSTGDLGAWRFESSMSVARIDAVAFSGSTRVFVGGGLPGPAPTIHASFEEAVVGADGVLGTFTGSEPLNVPRSGAGAGTVGSVFIVTGGVTTGDTVRADTETTLCLDCDADGDGVVDGADNCPGVPNASQVDGDSDGLGDACDACPADALNDADGDGVCGNVDNCPSLANPTQADADGDGLGDACDTDVDGDGVTDTAEACFCLGSAPGAATTTQGCDVDQLCPCAAPLGRSGWYNHREYIWCVRAVTRELQTAGAITSTGRQDLVRAAARSTCGN